MNILTGAIPVQVIDGTVEVDASTERQPKVNSTCTAFIQNAPNMVPVAAPVYNAPKPVDDITDLKDVEIHMRHLSILAPHIAVAERIHEANEFTAQKILSSLSFGLRKSGEFLAVAMYNYSQAYTARKRAEALALLDDFPAWAKSQDIKPTESIRSAFVDAHPSVLEAREKENRFEAFKEQLSVLKQQFTMAIASVRSSVYSYKDSNRMSASNLLE